MSPTIADSIDKENPFEYTWGILRALKAEVRDLQAAVAAEQRQREDEVGQLQRELKDLKAQLEREKADRQIELKNTVDPVKGNLSAMKEEVRTMKANREAQIHALTEALDDEKKERKQDVSDIGDRLTTEEKTRTLKTDSLYDDLTETKRMLDATGSDARLNIRNLTQDVRVIADQLTRVGNTYKAFNTSDLVSVQAPSGMSPKPPASNPPTSTRPLAGPFAS